MGQNDRATYFKYFYTYQHGKITQYKTKVKLTLLVATLSP